MEPKVVTRVQVRQAGSRVLVEQWVR
jgi:hypothetical protein